jgi:hypothetical protein
MMRFDQEFPGGRITLYSGSIPVGAAFPPTGENQHRLPWVWRLWVNGSTCATEGAAKTEFAAKDALLCAWCAFLTKAALRNDTELAEDAA